MILTGVLASQLVAVNLITNGTFDADGTGWSSLARNGGNTAAAGSTYVSFNDGVCFLKRTSSVRAGASYGGIQQDIFDIVIGATYEVQFSYRISGTASSSVTSTYTVILGGDTPVNGELGSSNNIKLNVVAGSNSSSFSLFANTGDNALTAMIDNVVLTKI
jgi:hypothetical protein